MVAGRQGLLADANTLRAGPVFVRASGKRCRVPAATPLAALVRTLTRAKVGYHVRDFGRCSARRASSSGQLFVDRIAKERNSGQNGWFYKVDGRAGTGGAGDPSALPGGSLRTGQRVLWFYCVFDSRARSCQRSLDAVPVHARGTPGEPLLVRVRGRDNEGAHRPLEGALVKLGPVSGRSDEAGLAKLVLPGPGRYPLRASKEGAVPSFPVAIEVTGGP